MTIFWISISADKILSCVTWIQAYEADKKNWLATDKFSERIPGLFKPEFVGTRGMELTAK